MSLRPAAPSRTHAVLIGIETYAAGPSWDLDGPANDVLAMHGWLRGREVPASQIQTLVSVLADHVRTGLKRYISNKYTAGSSTLSVCLLANDIEQRLRRVPEQPLTPDESSRLVEAVRVGLSQQTRSAPLVLLTNLDVRSPARAVLREEFPALSVLCYQELSPDLNISPIAKIAWT